jgi:hypothetical protein
MEDQGDQEDKNGVDGQGDLEPKKGKGPVVTASTVDTMLQGDSRFWDVIADKRKEVVKQGSSDTFWGPTVGRRRGESKKAEGTDDGNEKAPQSSSKDGQVPLPTFSIGNEFDFLPVSSTSAEKKTETPPLRDSLMDALNALDEDEAHDNTATEEIIFDVPASTLTTAAGDSGPASNESTPLFSNVDGGNTTTGKSDQANGPTASSGEMTTVAAEAAVLSVPSSSAASQKDEDEVEDMDELLASTDDFLADLNLGDLDDDDDGDLDDLEAMLKI